MTGIALIINQGRGSPTLPSRIALLNRRQLTVSVNGIRKHEDTGIRDVPEVTRGRGWERSNQDRRIRGGDLGRFGMEFNRDRIDILNTPFFVGNHVCDGTRSQPKSLSALGKWDLERFDSCFNGCDVDRLLIPTRSETKHQPPARSRKTCFRDISPPISCVPRDQTPQEGTNNNPHLNLAHAHRGWGWWGETYGISKHTRVDETWNSLLVLKRVLGHGHEDEIARNVRYTRSGSGQLDEILRRKHV